jgi:hypothetical protein
MTMNKTNGNCSMISLYPFEYRYDNTREYLYPDHVREIIHPDNAKIIQLSLAGDNVARTSTPPEQPRVRSHASRHIDTRYPFLYTSDAGSS